VILGTRGSALALAQARAVAQALAGDVELRVVRTHGDDSSAPLHEIGERREGVFVGALEDALRRGDIDIAVHSLKDLPTGERDGLVVAAVPAREDARDVVITRGRSGLAGLALGARIGTGSPRRAAFLRARRPDATCSDIRGNVDTRLRKVAEGAYDAAVLALAGLRRLGVSVGEHEILSLEDLPPAPGQGALAVQCRADDERTRRRLGAIDDLAVHAATDAERALLHALGGSCEIPLGAYAWADRAEVVLEAALATPGGVRRVRERGREPHEVGDRAAAALGSVHV
jgi:hydroxymethylbilane synthase